MTEIYEKFSPQQISIERREQLINEDPGTKSNQQVAKDIAKLLKSQSEVFHEVTTNMADDLMSLINVALTVDATGEESESAYQPQA